jgi:hypothetical protein
VTADQKREKPVVNVPTLIVSSDDILVTNTNFFNGMDHFPGTMKSIGFSTLETSRLRMKTWKSIKISGKVVFIS